MLLGFPTWHGSRGRSTEVGHRLRERMDMDDRRSGFSIIELVVVLMVGSVLTSIATTNVPPPHEQSDRQNAQSQYDALDGGASVRAIRHPAAPRLA